MSRFRLQIGIAIRPMPGELECGDQATVVHDGSRTLVVLADGVGHGAEAATAARAAIASVTRNPWLPLATVLDLCHRDLAQTRGAALTVLRLDVERGEVEHVGVGNVEISATTRESIRLVALPGIVGGHVRKVRITCQRIHPGDTLVVHTDGVSRRLDHGRYFDLDASSLAKKLLEEYGSPHDDAGCVVVRC